MVRRFKLTARQRILLRVILVVLGAALLLYYVPTGYVVVMPGLVKPARDLVEVEGGMKNSKGQFLLTTVSTREATLLYYLYGMLDPNVSLVPRESVLPEGLDWDKYLEQSRLMMQESQAMAKVAALRAVGLDARIDGEGAKVIAILEGSPAKGVLQEGDIIVGLNDVEITSADQLVNQMREVKVGDQVRIKLKRSDKHLEVTVPTVSNPNAPEKAALRVAIQTVGMKAVIPINVKIDPGQISGPSAGLVFALEIVDELSSEDITGGRKIAGTGTIDPAGIVGEVGGVRQKVIAAEQEGADVFLVPPGNYSEAQKAARIIKVLPVNSLHEALAKLTTDVRPPQAAG